MIATYNSRTHLSPPGGVYRDTLIVDDKIVHEGGKAIAAYNNPVQFRQITMLNSISSSCIIVALMLYAMRIFVKRRFISFLLYALLFSSVASFGYAYSVSLQIITPDHDEYLEKGWDFVSFWFNMSVTVWLVIVGIFLLDFITK